MLLGVCPLAHNIPNKFEGEVSRRLFFRGDTAIFILTLINHHSPHSTKINGVCNYKWFENFVCNSEKSGVPLLKATYVHTLHLIKNILYKLLLYVYSYAKFTITYAYIATYVPSESS